MTDQLKPLPCAYCRVVPNVNDEDDFWDEPIVERWAEKGCFVCHQFTSYPIAAWNDDQEKLLELRTKDYYEGWMARDARHGRELFGEGLKELMCEDYIKGKGDE